MTRMDKITVTVLVLVVLAYLVVGGYLDYRWYHPGALSPTEQAEYEALLESDAAYPEPEDCDDPWCY